MLAHDIADFERSSWISPGRPALLKPRPPTKKEEAALKIFLQLEPLGCTVSTTASLRPAVVARGGYAALKAERPLQVVQLWLFLDVAGDQYALMSPCARFDIQSSMSYAFWQNQNYKSLAISRNIKVYILDYPRDDSGEYINLSE